MAELLPHPLVFIQFVSDCWAFTHSQILKIKIHLYTSLEYHPKSRLSQAGPIYNAYDQTAPMPRQV